MVQNFDYLRVREGPKFWKLMRKILHLKKGPKFWEFMCKRSTMGYLARECDINQHICKLKYPNLVLNVDYQHPN